MKNTIFIFLAISATIISGCNNWLEVNPKTEKTKDKLLTSQQGFQDALTGAYIQMIQNQAYGANLTYDMIESMASLYDTETGSVNAELKAHNWGHTEAETKINNVFGKLYKIISNANSMLEEIDGKKNVFDTDNDYSMIKGEALAIRAMCHFDLLRLFGPIPSEQISGEKILPYVTRFGRELTEHSTWDDYCGSIIKDLKDAEELLKGDPILEYSVSDLQNPNTNSSEYKTDNLFFAYRPYRFNYYAVKALQARVNIWIGNPEEALAAAKVVISAKNSDGSQKFELGTSTAFASNDLLLTSEHIMALYDFSLAKKYTASFATGVLYKGTTYTKYIKSNLYGTTGVDMREPEVGKWWAIYVKGNGATNCISNKYFTNSSTDINIGMRIPLLRLAEMYLIVAETAPISEAQSYYDTFLRARNLTTIELNENDRMSTLRKEYLKEFYAEGYIFYVYKRLNSPRTDILWSASTLVPDYVLPKPSDELIYDEE